MTLLITLAVVAVLALAVAVGALVVAGRALADCDCCGEDVATADAQNRAVESFLYDRDARRGGGR